MDACKGRGVRQADFNRVLSGVDADDVQRGEARALEGAARGEDEAVALLALRHAHGDFALERLEVQGIVAGGEAPDLDEAVDDGESLAPIPDELVLALFQQREGGRHVGALEGGRQAQDLALASVQLGREGAGVRRRRPAVF